MPFVETLESYSRALYLPLRSYIRRPFQFVTDSIRDHIPKGLWDIRNAMEHTVLGSSRLVGPFDGFGAASTLSSSSSSGNSGMAAASSNSANGASTASGAGIASNNGVNSGSGAKLLYSQPSMIHFFTSPYFLLLCFMSIVMNRINAIVAPRNPHPLKLSVRFALKLPAFYLLMKSVLITLALTTQNQPTLPFAWMLAGLRTSYNESQALWLSFIAMGVSGTVDSFIANLHSTATHEHSINMLEWAILFHFTPFGRDILVISLIQVCQLLTLQFLTLSSRGKDYRLIVTTFWGLLDLAHFGHAMYYRSNTYPSLQMLTRLPEVVVLLIVCISMTLHTLTYIVTGGNVRRQMFEPRAMPTMEEEYSLAIFKLGRACMEATRGVGLRNEVDAVVVPFGTILDRKQIAKAKAAIRAHNQQYPSSSSTSSNTSGQRFGQVPPGFSNEMPDIVETPGQRQHISRRRNRMNVMKAFCQSGASLMIEASSAIYSRIVPARFRRTVPASRDSRNRMTVQEYIQLRTTIENAFERSQLAGELRLQDQERRFNREAAALDEEEEQEIYSDFLSRDLTVSDDEDDEYDVDFMTEDEDSSDNEDDEFDIETEGEQPAGQAHEVEVEEGESFGIGRYRHYDSEDEDDLTHDPNQEAAGQISSWRSLGSLQDFFLDTSFMSIFLSGRLQDSPLTRSQYRLAMNGSREFQQDVADYDGSQGAEGSSSSNSNTTGSGLGRLSRRKRNSNETNNRALLAVLNKYRRTVGGDKLDTSVGPMSSSNMAPPPLAKASVPEDNTIYSRIGSNNAHVAENANLQMVLLGVDSDFDYVM
ncbi:hypothetical protein BGZ51_004680 [Haplosporangium sp. Z 767]|nr:hypothetical protein BGZ51_004680 [Haplosporangium sp. Z 767]